MALNNKSLVISKLFGSGKCFKPKTLLYYAYKCAKNNGVDIGHYNIVLSNIIPVLNKSILSCEESFGLSVHFKALRKWDWSVAKTMPNSLFLTLMNYDVDQYDDIIGDNLQDTMIVCKELYFKDRRVRQPNGVNLTKICSECFNNEDNPNDFTYLLDSATFVEDIEDYITDIIRNDRDYWCQQCYTMPLFTLLPDLHPIIANWMREERREKRGYDSSSDEDVESYSRYVKHPKSDISLDE